MTTLEETLRKKDEDRASDAEKFNKLDDDLCMLCGAHGEDKRSLRMEYFYDLKEQVPEMLDLANLKPEEGGFYLRTCKWCRGELLGLLRVWRETCVARRDFEKDHDGYITEEGAGDRNIPVRVDGRIMWMTLPEYEDYKRAHNG